MAIDFKVTVFYRIKELPDMVFHENVNVLAGSRTNAKTNGKAEEVFLDLLEDECNFFRRNESNLPDLEVEIVDKKIYEDFDTSLRMESILDKKLQAEHKKELERQKEIKRIEEEQRKRERAKQEEGSNFLESVKDHSLLNILAFLHANCTNRSELTQLKEEDFYKFGIRYKDVQKFKELLSTTEQRAIFEKYELSPLRKSWIESEIYNLKPENDLDITTAELLSRFPQGYKNPLEKVKDFLPVYISGFEHYERDDLLNVNGVGEGTIKNLRTELRKQGYDLKGLFDEPMETKKTPNNIVYKRVIKAPRIAPNDDNSDSLFYEYGILR